MSEKETQNSVNNNEDLNDPFNEDVAPVNDEKNKKKVDLAQEKKDEAKAQRKQISKKALKEDIAKTQDNAKKITNSEERFPSSELSKLTWGGVIWKITDWYLNTKLDLNKDNLSPQAIASAITSKVAMWISARNSNPDFKHNKWQIPHDLLPQQIASCLAKLNHVVLIDMSSTHHSSDYALLAVYKTDGYDKGIYSTDRGDLQTLARKYNYSLTKNDMKEIEAALRTMVPHVARNDNRDLIPVNNGIYNYRTKVLLPFDPKYIFTAKSHVDYVENAQNPEIHNDADGTDWDVVSWMKSLSDDPQVVNVLWEILGAIIRPNVSWNMTAWLYSTHGNNGKGTLCELMRNLCGPGSYAKIALRDFGQDFMLEPLTHASAIIVDENDVGTYIDRAANLKAVVTGDVITINRKFLNPVAYQFHGFMVQCLNEYPKVKDRSESFYRRLMFVPMQKNFQGHERKYIKDEYLHRPDVLQYVLYCLLHDTNYYSLDVPDVCRETMEDYKSFNDPVRQFAEDILPQCQWDLAPYSFLYDIYRKWFIENVPNGKAIGSRSFAKELKELCTYHAIGGFKAEDNKQYRSADRMEKPEPLIRRYHLTKWINSNASGTDPVAQTIPNNLREKYRGLIRVDGADSND